MASTITTNSTSAQTKWLDEVRKGYLRGNLLSPFMGSGMDAAIHIENVAGKAGDKVRTHFVRRPPNSARVSGDTKAKGNEYPYAQTTDELSLQLERFAVSVQNVAESEQRTIVDVRREAQGLLEPWMKEVLFADVMDAMMDTTNRSQSRYLYGSSNANWNAVEATAKANVDATDDKLSLDLLSLAKRKATLDGNFRITPAKIGSAHGAPVEGYIGLFHSYQIRDLKSDPSFKNHVLYNKAFEVYNGAFYVGTFDGIAIYEIPYEGMLESGVGANGIQIGHGLILGAGAGKVGYAPVANGKRSSDGRMSVNFEEEDYGNDLGICASEVRGQKKLGFANPGTATTEDFGVVNVITAAVAD